MELINISQKYDKNLIIDNFSYSFPETGCIALLGPAKCGKTLLTKLILGLIKPTSGEIVCDPKKTFSMVLQENQIFENLTCLEHIKKFMGDNSTEDPNEYLQDVFLDSAAKLKPAKLKDATLRRLAIAMALAYDGDIFVLDDPFREIEPDIKRSIIEKFKSIKKQKLIIFTSKAEAEAKDFADIILHLTANPLKIKLKTITHF